jgi:hypothetical protein
MSKIHNIRIDRHQSEQIHERSFKEEIKFRYANLKQKIKNTPKSKKIFFIVLMFVNLIIMTFLGFTFAGMKQSIFMTILLVIDLFVTLILFKTLSLKKSDFLKVLALFCILLTLISSFFSLYIALNLDKFFAINAEISQAKRNSVLVLETSMVEVYINYEDQMVYAISNIDGQKYVNQNHWCEEDSSEFYNLYTIGFQMDSPDEELTELFIYPPSPYTMTGYDYLIEFIYNKQRYVTKIFIPGYIDLKAKASSKLCKLTYKNNDSRYFDVRRIDNYLVFQGEYSAFATPFQNVEYSSDNEYFFLRYNRYLRAMNPDIALSDEITENNVRFARSLSVMSTSIKKINFFWIGTTTSNGVFVAEFPVIEIIYNNNTCDVAVIRDIDPANLLYAQ